MTARGARGGRGSRRAIVELLDLLGRRWSLRVLWELRDGPLSFRALRERCDEVSPSVLNARLRELREAEIVELGAAGYQLSPSGEELGRQLLDLSAWAERSRRRRRS